MLIIKGGQVYDLHVKMATWMITEVNSLTEVFPCFLLSFKANARVKPTKMGHGPHSS
jgi:hypothetical protein